MFCRNRDKLDLYSKIPYTRNLNCPGDFHISPALKELDLRAVLLADNGRLAHAITRDRAAEGFTPVLWGKCHTNMVITIAKPATGRVMTHILSCRFGQERAES